MPQFFEVWDDTTANRLGEFHTIDDARVVLSAVLRDSGPDAARSLSVLSYISSGPDSDDYEVVTVLEGADFVAEVSSPPAYPTS